MIIELIEYANNVSVEVKGVRLISIVEHNIPSGIPTSIFTSAGTFIVGLGEGVVIETGAPTEDGQVWKSDLALPMKGRWVTADTARDAQFNVFSNIAVREWTPRTSAADNQWLSVCWSPELGLFVAVAGSGAGNRVMTSL